MKKNIPYIIVIAVCVLITITTTIVACSTVQSNRQESSENTQQDTTDKDTLSLPTHNSPTETIEATNTTTCTETETTEEVTTLKVTEPIIIQTEETDAPKEEYTTEEIKIEDPEPETEPQPEPEPETEPVIETEEPQPIISLEYVSNGNGTCALVGIGNVTDTYISIPTRSPAGDVVTSIEEGAFYGNQTVRAIEIPSTVATIGDLAFANCPELVYISVDKSNKLFTDIGGILYSADMTKLLSFPAASGAASITIPSSVTQIANMAFYGCNNLKAINYEGTVEEWSKIFIGDMNYSLLTASIICIDPK